MGQLEQLTMLTATIGRVEKAVIGINGEGLISRTARIEEKTIAIADMAKEAKEAVILVDAQMDKRFGKLADALTTLATDVDKLTDSVVAHHKTDHLAGWLRKPKFYLYITVAFIALHEIATAFGIGIQDLLHIVGIK